MAVVTAARRALVVTIEKAESPRRRRADGQEPTPAGRSPRRPQRRYPDRQYLAELMSASGPLFGRLRIVSRGATRPRRGGYYSVA